METAIRNCIRAAVFGAALPALFLSVHFPARAAVYRLEDGSLLDTDYYRTVSPDAVQMTGDSDQAMIDHFLWYGKVEGRAGVSPLADPAALEKSAVTVPSRTAGVDTVSGEAVLSTSGGYVMGDKVRKALSSGLSSAQGRNRQVGFVMTDLYSGMTVAYNADEPLYSASSIKGPYVLAVAALSPDSVKEYGDMMYQILRYSDNERYEQLYGIYGGDVLKEWWQQAGNGDLDSTAQQAFHSYYYFYSARQLARLWVRNYSFLAGTTQGRAMGPWLERPNASVIYERLHGKYLTMSKAGWIAAGDTSKNINATDDGGIVYCRHHPYVIAIMSNIPKDFTRLRALTDALEAAHQEMITQIRG